MTSANRIKFNKQIKKQFIKIQTIVIIIQKELLGLMQKLR